ncbi:MAG: DNA alkylation repair protein [Bacteroidetes bacterium]|nr:DNA alkylation repair protein [Bacteroidota bacterium]
MHPFLLPLEKQFVQYADITKAEGMKAYMRCQFEFYGIAMNERRNICKVFIQTNPLPSVDEVEKVVKYAWKEPQREWQYFAIELLWQYKKQWKKSTIKIIEYCITHKSWWDTVDAMASDWAGVYFKIFPDQIITITGNWNRSENIWLQRTSLLFQKKYKETTDIKILSGYILNLAASEAFFIRKAIGWSLREYAKTNPEWVRSFVDKHKLSSLSRREAIKNI